jgi:2-iminobutanoate/2-iminopropanoate deaminase
MLKRLNPEGAPRPLSNYSLGVLVPAGMTTFHVSGQVGTDAAGNLPDDAEGQCRNAFANVLAVMAGAGMGPGDIVSLTTFLTGPEHLPAYRSAREAAFGDVAPGSTMVYVAGLVDPKMVIEVQAIAAK